MIRKRYKTEEKTLAHVTTKNQTGEADTSMPLEDVFAKLAIKKPKESFVGQGHNAAVRVLPNGTLLKTGKIGLWEAPAMIAARGIRGIPEIYSYSRNTIHCEGAWGGSLKYLLKKRKFSEQDKKYIIDDLICLLRDLHCRNISHNDLHSGNVFWCPGLMQVHLIDFGYAKMTVKAACNEALTFLFRDKTPDGDKSVFKVLELREPSRIENILRNNLRRIGITEDTYSHLGNSMDGVCTTNLKRLGLDKKPYETEEYKLDDWTKSTNVDDYEAMIEAVYDGIPETL